MPSSQTDPTNGGNTQHNTRQITVVGGGFDGQLKKYVDDEIDGDVLWCCRYLYSNKDAVIKSHLDFLRAGATIAVTNTYQANIELFKKHLNISGADSYNLIKNSVDLARIACDRYLKDFPESPRPQIAGSIGPYGASLHDGSEYTGAYAKHMTSRELQIFHLPRIQALINGGVDFLALETIPCRLEAEAVIQLVKELYPQTKLWISFSAAQDGRSISNGDNFQETARYCYDLNPNKIIAVGVNCLSPRLVEPLIKDINNGRENNPVPLVVYPNSGETYEAEKGWNGKENCKPLETFVEGWLDLGVTWIGGCCRTDASDVTKICTEIEKWKQKKCC